MDGLNLVTVSPKCVSMFMRRILGGELWREIFKFMLAVLEILKLIVILFSLILRLVGGPKARFTVDQAIITPLHLINLPEVVKSEL